MLPGNALVIRAACQAIQSHQVEDFDSRITRPDPLHHLRTVVPNDRELREIIERFEASNSVSWS